MNRSLYTGVSAIEPPGYIKRLLEVRGGLNRYGEPNYRLVRAEARYRLSGGEWVLWPSYVPISERNARFGRPVRSEVGFRRVPLYPNEYGLWILEKWLAPEKIMDRADWYKPEAQGGTVRMTSKGPIAALGDYPERGDYVGTHYHFPSEAVTEPVIAQAVGMLEYAHARRPADPRARRAMEVAAGEQEEAASEQAFTEYALAQLEESGAGWSPWSLEGRAYISKLAESIGIRVHPF